MEYYWYQLRVKAYNERFCLTTGLIVVDLKILSEDVLKNFTPSLVNVPKSMLRTKPLPNRSLSLMSKIL